jgi:hypothetical protein
VRRKSGKMDLGLVPGQIWWGGTGCQQAETMTFCTSPVAHMRRDQGPALISSTNTTKSPKPPSCRMLDATTSLLSQQSRGDVSVKSIWRSRPKVIRLPGVGRSWLRVSPSNERRACDSLKQIGHSGVHGLDSLNLSLSSPCNPIITGTSGCSARTAVY